MSGMELQTEFSAAILGEYTFEVLREVADEETLHRLFDSVLKEVRKAEKKIYEQS